MGVVLNLFQDIDPDLGWRSVGILISCFVISYIFLITNGVLTLKIEDDCVTEDDKRFSIVSILMPIIILLFMAGVYKLGPYILGANRRIRRPFGPSFELRSAQYKYRVSVLEDRIGLVTFFMVYFFLCLFTIAQSFLLFVKENLCSTRKPVDEFSSSMAPPASTEDVESSEQNEGESSTNESNGPQPSVFFKTQLTTKEKIGMAGVLIGFISTVIILLVISRAFYIVN